MPSRRTVDFYVLYISKNSKDVGIVVGNNYFPSILNLYLVIIIYIN